MKENVIKEKSRDFALRVIKLYVYLRDEKHVHVLSKQLLRSGTSIGANVREGLAGQSDADFISKFSIALKEAEETDYWLDLLHASNCLSDKEYESIQNDLKEVTKLLVSIIKSNKDKLIKK